MKNCPECAKNKMRHWYLVVLLFSGEYKNIYYPVDKEGISKQDLMNVRRNSGYEYN